MSVHTHNAGEWTFVTDTEGEVTATRYGLRIKVTSDVDVEEAARIVQAAVDAAAGEVGGEVAP